jgi:hypothetical protein
MPHPRILATAAGLLVAGIVLVVLADAVALAAVGWGLQGVGAVILVSYAFLLVGESEDRDRMRNPRG